MPAHFYVYVGLSSAGNYEKGKAKGIWGWTSSVLDGGNGAESRSNRDVARTIRTGDYLIFGFYVPGGPRAKNHQEFFNGTLTEATVTRVVRPLYESAAEVWTDKLYPERIDLEVLDTFAQVSGRQLGLPAMHALRMSGNKQGAPVGGGPPAATALASAAENQTGDSVDFEGDLDALTAALRRREQRRLRKMKFGTQAIIRCDLCGRDLPARLVTAAHIKRRADATRNERLDMNNIMAACLLGCDALFENGHVHVDSGGKIRVAAGVAGDLLAAVHHLAGRRCTAYDKQSRPYFEAHASRFVQKRVDTAWQQADWDVSTNPAATERPSAPGQLSPRGSL
ncbi:hypothetical protein ACSNN9_06600 [Micromonospora sp. URMC 107]|uniref:hypothetical protein n=1 Tax=Micromonospora sp. URMC 107 TaxID=3423418 RepID=UPI003F196429